MKKPYRQSDGFYHVDGKKYKTLFGSREQVMNGTVYKTTGGLIQKDLVMNKWGRIVSADKYKTAKKEMRLQKHGFFAKKGKFGAVTRKVRGGKTGVPADNVETDQTPSTTASEIDQPLVTQPGVTSPRDYHPSDNWKYGIDPSKIVGGRKSKKSRGGEKSKGKMHSPVDTKSKREKRKPGYHKNGKKIAEGSDVSDSEYESESEISK